MTRVQRVAFRLGLWLLNRSGNAGANEWRDLNASVADLSDMYTRESERRMSLSRAMMTLRTAVMRADTLLSDGQTDKAQSQLRFALIESRGEQ